MSFRAEILAEARLIPTESGGRKTPITTVLYGCPFGIGTEFFDMRIDLSGAVSLSPGQTARVPMAFVCPHLVLPRLRVGMEFTLWEGKTIGWGTVIEIYANG
jgi:hypothetical protein